MKINQEWENIIKDITNFKTLKFQIFRHQNTLETR